MKCLAPDSLQMGSGEHPRDGKINAAMRPFPLRSGYSHTRKRLGLRQKPIPSATTGTTLCFQISSGVALVLSALLFLLLLQAFESFCAMLFYASSQRQLAVIVGGLRHGAFVKKHPAVDREQMIINKMLPSLHRHSRAIRCRVDNYRKRIHPIAGMTEESFDMIITAPFMFIIACSTFTIVYSSMLKSKYNIETQQRKDPRPSSTSSADV